MDFTQFLAVSICAAIQVGLTQSSSGYEKCNETVLVGDLTDMKTATLTLKMANVRKPDRGKPLYCWFRFEGAPGQFIQVDVKNVRAGIYDVNTQECDDGYLRISDKESCSTEPDWLPPTTLCGTYVEGQIRVRRRTKVPKALVEFKLDKARSSMGYEFDVTFLNADADEKLPYGDLQRTDGKIANTRCDWLIPVETCYSWCNVVSPGYPGIYPPNTRCRYQLTNFDDKRIELKMGGKGFTGKFDMKRSENCSEDHVSVYDGMSTVSPLIGRFCGLDGAHLISSGPSLLLIFEAGPGGPPWDYSGFDLQTTERWKNEHEGGDLAGDTKCEWTFVSESLESKDGDVHTPDHRTENDTRCEYRFEGKYNEKIELRVVVTALDPECSEYIEVLEGEKQMLQICASNLTERRNEFLYTSDSPTTIVKYYSAKGKLANPSASWIYFQFKEDPTVKGPPASYTNTGVVDSGCTNRHGLFGLFTFIPACLLVSALLRA